MTRDKQRQNYIMAMDKHGVHDIRSITCSDMWKKFMQLNCICLSKPCNVSCGYCEFAMTMAHCLVDQRLVPRVDVINQEGQKVMRTTAYKVLDSEFKSTFQGFSWPLPLGPKGSSPREPGAWLEIEGEPKLCARGFHGFLTKEGAFKHLLSTAGGHVYEMEFEGSVRSDYEKICGTRARITREIFEEAPIPWEEFVKGEKYALSITAEARRQRLATNTVDLTKTNLVPGTYPVFPAYHKFRVSSIEKVATKKMCGDCGVHEAYHDGWEARAALSDKFLGYDKYELILYIQQIQNGKTA